MASAESSSARGRAVSSLKGIGWMVLSGILFACFAGAVRYVGSAMNPIQAVFIRFVFGLVILAPVLIRVSFPPRRIRLYGLRGVVHGIGIILWFYAIARIPLADVAALGFTIPIFITIGAALFLGEQIRLRRIVAVLAGFVGVLVVLRPGIDAIQLGAVAQLVSAPMLAASYLMAKRLTETETSASIVAYMTVFAMLALLPPALAVWRTPTWEELGWLFATAVLATLGHISMTQAYRSAEMSVTQPAAFLQIVWATLIGVVVFSEAPDLLTWVGAAIVVGAVTYIAHREAAAGKRKVSPPPTV